MSPTVKKYAYSLFPLLLLCLSLATVACQRQSQNAYRYDEVGKSSAVSFGTIVSSRSIDIIGQNTGGGALLGGAAGGAAGSYIGGGSGQAWAVAGGALAGAALGALAEQAAADRGGLEYVVVLESGVTMTIVQEIGKGERMLQVGERVIVQNQSGYQRVLPASHLPEQIQRPKGIKVVD